MPVIPYVKNPTWADGSGGGTSIDAADLNKIEAGVFEAHLQPAVRVTHSAAQSIATATPTTLAFNTERFDTAGGAADTQHDTVTNNSRLTCKYAGKYQISAHIEFAANSTGVRQLELRVNATTTVAFTELNATTIGSQRLDVTTLWDLAVNDFVEVRVTQNSGAALNLNVASAYSPEFMMVRVA